MVSFKAPSLRLRNMKTISKVDKQNISCGYSLKTVVKVVTKIQNANQRDTHAFQRLLGLAYGRNGKLKWELLEVCNFFRNELAVAC